MSSWLENSIRKRSRQLEPHDDSGRLRLDQLCTAHRVPYSMLSKQRAESGDSRLSWLSLSFMQNDFAVVVCEKW